MNEFEGEHDEHHIAATQTKKGVSAIIYDKNGDFYFLILKREKNWQGWEFCKGGIQGAETALDALKREIHEETGIERYNIVGRLKRKRTFVNNGTTYEFEVFLIETNMNTPVNIHHNTEREHSTYLWATADTVSQKLHWQNEKEIFNDGLRYLREVKHVQQKNT